MRLNKLYDYQDLSRTEINGTRFYNVGSTKLPSVTTILSATADKGFLEVWKERVGDVEAARIVEESSILGTALHKNLENYLLNLPERVGSPFAKMMSSAIINKGLKNVPEIWGTEVPLFYPELYAGTADVVAIHGNEPAIIDFKNSRGAKKEEWIEDYFCQLVSYALAHNAVYGTKIRKGVIMMMNRDGRYQEFIITGVEFDKYEIKWLDRLYTYHQNTINI